MIFRAIAIRGSVHPAAVVLDKDKMLAFADILGALKHHVLEKVSEARPSSMLVSRSRIVDNRDGIRRRRVVLGQDHTQTVLEFVFRELHGLRHC